MEHPYEMFLPLKIDYQKVVFFPIGKILLTMPLFSTHPPIVVVRTFIA